MKKLYTLDCDHYYDFEVLAISSHIKPYKLCWILNQNIGFNFEKSDNHKVNQKLIFTRYKSVNADESVFNLLVNRSKKGYMIASQKSINFFLIINKKNQIVEKNELLTKLRAINDILLVFEFELEKEKNSDRFIIYDKKN